MFNMIEHFISIEQYLINISIKKNEIIIRINYNGQ